MSNKALLVVIIVLLTGFFSFMIVEHDGSQPTEKLASDTDNITEDAHYETISTARN